MNCPKCNANHWWCKDDGTEICMTPNCGYVKPVKSVSNWWDLNIRFVGTLGELDAGREIKTLDIGDTVAVT